LLGNWFWILQAPADVEKTKPTDGQLLQYDATAKQWKLVTAGTLGATGFLYFGNPLTNGTWRIGRSGNNLNFERREAGVWVKKSAATP